MKKQSEIQRRILQIMPSDGWQAIYQDGENEISTPVTCWALVEEDDDYEKITHVVGMEAEAWVDFCDNMSNFLRYERINQ